ncbi:HEPN domain-containing protein [Desulfobacterales bacterium HSG2]|nr:HEPN domain-containing protein [Desulfobacterales bacterium HSG2]
MNNEEHRSELVRYWWSKAEESMASAKREFEAESYSITVNRLYYSVFYGVSAALFVFQKAFGSPLRISPGIRQNRSA